MLLDPFRMFVVDMLQFWLTASILGSWIVSRHSKYGKYFFPVPSIPLRPAQLMGGQMAQSSLANYGMNVGPMAVGWVLRFINGRFEKWTGKALSQAYKAQRRAAREWETEEERAARKAARKAAKREAKARQQQRQEPPSTMPPDWMKPTNVTATTTDGEAVGGDSATQEVPSDSPNGNSPEPAHSEAHQEFLDQLEQHNTELDELD